MAKLFPLQTVTEIDRGGCMRYEAIIVGGGMAGLTAAAYLVRAGKRVLLCEKEQEVGGLVASFERGGFTFDRRHQGHGELRDRASHAPAARHRHRLPPQHCLHRDWQGCHEGHLPREPPGLRATACPALPFRCGRHRTHRRRGANGHGVPRRPVRHRQPLLPRPHEGPEVPGEDHPAVDGEVRPHHAEDRQAHAPRRPAPRAAGWVARDAGHGRAALLQGDPCLLRAELFHPVPRLQVPARRHGDPPPRDGAVHPAARRRDPHGRRGGARGPGGAHAHRRGGQDRVVEAAGLDGRPEDAVQEARRRRDRRGEDARRRRGEEGPHRGQEGRGLGVHGVPRRRRGPRVLRGCRERPLLLHAGHHGAVAGRHPRGGPLRRAAATTRTGPGSARGRSASSSSPPTRSPSPSCATRRLRPRAPRGSS